MKRIALNGGPWLPTNKDGHLEGITATIQKNKNEIHPSGTRKTGSSWMDVPEVENDDLTTTHCVFDVSSQRQVDERYVALSRNQLFAKYVSHVIPSLTGSELYQQTLAQHTIELYRKMCIKQRL